MSHKSFIHLIINENAFDLEGGIYNKNEDGP